MRALYHAAAIAALVAASASADPILVDTLTPIATGVVVNGGGIAARAGYIYVEEYPGNESYLGSRVFRIAPDGTIDHDWLTGVVSGWQPYISRSGELWVIGSLTTSFTLTLRVDAYSLDNGTFLGPRFVDSAHYWYSTTVSELLDGTILYGTSNYPTDVGGVRRVVSASTSEEFSPGFGNNVYLAALDDGRVLENSSANFGVIPSGGGPYHTVTVFATGDVESIVPLGDGSVLVATEFTVWHFSNDLSTMAPFLRTIATRFRSMALDRELGRIVVRTLDGKIYSVISPDQPLEVQSLDWGQVKAQYRSAP